MAEEARRLFAFGEITALHPLPCRFHVKQRTGADIKVDVGQETVGGGVLNKVNVGHKSEGDLHFKVTPGIFDLPFKTVVSEGAQKVARSQLEAVPRANGQCGAVQVEVGGGWWWWW